MMKAVDFEYACPVSLAAACKLLADGGPDARLLAGGQTLVPLMAMRLARPALVIDINRIADLQGVDERDGTIAVRGCTRQADVLDSPVVRRGLPLLAKALSFVGHVQTRSRGTLGGSLANADPAAEIGIAALALDGEIEARSVNGSRRIPIGNFLVSPMVTTLRPDECLTAARFKPWRTDGALGTGFQEISIRRSDFALAAAAVQITLDRSGVCRQIAVSVGAAGTTPVRLSQAERELVGTKLKADDLANADRLACNAIEAISDLHASAAHRRRIVGMLVARAIVEARDDALGHA